MRNFLNIAALLGGMAIGAPAWAQSAEDLNRQELSRLLGTTAVPSAPASAVPAVAQNPVAPQQAFIADPVGLIAADGPRPPPARFPGLINLLGFAVLAGGYVVTTAAVGPPPP